MSPTNLSPNFPTPRNTSQTSKSIENLRAQAQSHLQEIEQEKASEHLDRLSKDVELQKYAKQRKSSLSPANPSSPPESDTKGPRLRTAQDVLDRIKHDSSLSTSEYVIGYLERFDGIMEMPVSNWIRESTDEDFIPQHRIRWIKRRQLAGEEAVEEVVWSRDERIDKIFGSRSGTER
jgi:uncharacterized protein (UPF0248 family)